MLGNEGAAGFRLALRAESLGHDSLNDVVLRMTDMLACYEFSYRYQFMNG